MKVEIFSSDLHHYKLKLFNMRVTKLIKIYNYNKKPIQNTYFLYFSYSSFLVHLFAYSMMTSIFCKHQRPKYKYLKYFNLQNILYILKLKILISNQKIFKSKIVKLFASIIDLKIYTKKSLNL